MVYTPGLLTLYLGLKLFSSLLVSIRFILYMIHFFANIYSYDLSQSQTPILIDTSVKSDFVINAHLYLMPRFFSIRLD